MDELCYGTQFWNFEDVKTCIKDFMDLYEARPIKNNVGGMTSTHLFWTCLLYTSPSPRDCS